MTREDAWRCDACNARIDPEGRGSNWQRHGIARRQGEVHAWDLCEPCDAQVLGLVNALRERWKKEKKR